MMSKRIDGPQRRSSIVQWFTASRADRRLTLILPSQVLDLAVIQPLQCLEKDEFQNNQITDDEAPIYAMRFCPVPGYYQLLAVANEDGYLSLHHTNKSGPEKSLERPSFSAHKNAIFDFAWCPTNASQLVTVSGDQSARLFDISVMDPHPQRLREYKGYTGSVRCCEWMAGSESVFATGSRDNSIFVWDIRSRGTINPENKLRNVHSDPEKMVKDSASVTGLTWLDENLLVSVGGGDGVIKVWDMRKSYSLYKRDPIPKFEIFHPGTSSHQGYTGVLNNRNNPYIYVSCQDHHVYKYDIVNYSQRPEAVYTGARINSSFIQSSLSHCGNFLASGSADHNVYVWNTASPGGPVATLGPQEEDVTCVTWSHRENVLASCTDNMQYRLWRPQRCQDKLQIKGFASMTGKLPPPPPSITLTTPLKPLTTTNSRLRSGSQLRSPAGALGASANRLTRNHRTPTSDRKQVRRTGNNSQLTPSTPSIKSFLTPKAAATGSPSQAGSASPLSSTAIAGGTGSAADTPTQPRGQKRRLPMDDHSAASTSSSTASSPPTKLFCRSAEEVAGMAACIGNLLENNGNISVTGQNISVSPVKCKFSPSNYQSPVKRRVPAENVYGRLSPPVRVYPSPLKTSVLTSNVTVSLFDSPLRSQSSASNTSTARHPLESIASPTANLPNMVRDGNSPRLAVRPEQPVTKRRVDWLTQLGQSKRAQLNQVKNDQEEQQSLTKRKTPKSKKKIGYKT